MVFFQWLSFYTEKNLFSYHNKNILTNGSCVAQKCEILKRLNNLFGRGLIEGQLFMEMIKEQVGGGKAG